MNEATLEARIDRVLHTVFPTFKEVKVEHQTSFTLKIGHHNIPFDSGYAAKNTVRGISDIILKIDGQNVILLELKQENVDISSADIAQGISYARLLDQMPAITLISNGKTNRFFNTYTKEEIITDSVDFSMISACIKDSFTLAANDFKDAVNLLLNNDPELFSHVINQITEQKFLRLTGEIGDLTKSICPDFIIDRTILAQIIKAFDEENPLIGIQGQAFSGKTMLLYQFFRTLSSSENFVFYLDCYDHNYSIYRQLANTFTKNSGIRVSEEQIREWLHASLRAGRKYRFYLLLDNFNDSVSKVIMDEILELIDIFDDGHHRILYTVDEFNFQQLAYVPFKNYKTVIGDKSKIVKLDELNDIEYLQANDLMFNKFKLIIENGGHYAPEYREPRIIRHLISLSKNDDLIAGQYDKIQAVPDVYLLGLLANNETYSKEIHRLMSMMADCFIEEFNLRKQNSELNIAASGSGSVTIDIFKRKYNDHYEGLLKSSITVIRHFRNNGLSILYPKLPELLAYYCIPIISRLLAENSERKNIDQNLTYFSELTVAVPYCDIVGAAVLIELSKTKPKLFSDLINRMLKIPPKKETISDETKLMLFDENAGHIDFDYEAKKYGNDGLFIADFFPFAVLSQLAAFPMGDENHDLEDLNLTPYNFHLTFIRTIASDPNFIHRADSRSLGNMRSYESYEWEGIGQIISGKEGIIEPIVQSIQKCFLAIPNEMKLLYEFGLKERNFNLLYRFYLALHGLINIGDQDIAEKAQTYVRVFHKFFSEFMAEYFSKNLEDIEQRNERYNSLIKLNIDEELDRLFLSEE
ncbi:hypothetical protein [Chryseobacterium sp. Marseille-Q8038]